MELVRHSDQSWRSNQTGWKMISSLLTNKYFFTSSLIIPSCSSAFVLLIHSADVLWSPPFTLPLFHSRPIWPTFQTSLQTFIQSKRLHPVCRKQHSNRTPDRQYKHTYHKPCQHQPWPSQGKLSDLPQQTTPAQEHTSSPHISTRLSPVPSHRNLQKQNPSLNPRSLSLAPLVLWFLKLAP
jgi:hypothetical protein